MTVSIAAAAFGGLVLGAVLGVLLFALLVGSAIRLWW